MPRTSVPQPVMHPSEPQHEASVSTHRRAGDAFPATATWLGGRVLEGAAGIGQANTHIMNIYAHPLKVYMMGCSLRWVGDPQDTVQGFFADRLSRADFLTRWLSSGRPLRFWLITGFKHYLFETARSIRKVRGTGSTDAAADAGIEITSDDPAGFDREVAMSLVREAMQRAQQGCVRDGLGKHWDLFAEHHVHDRPYDELAPRFGVDRARAAVMARTAANRFRGELRTLVAWEGATDEQIDREIRSLLEVTGS